MNGFNQRKKAFEAKYFHDEELRFRINIKCYHLFGQWAGGLLGYEDEARENYAIEVIVVEYQKTHDDDVIHKVLRDLEAAKVQISEHRVRKELEKCWKTAHKLIMNGEGI